MFYNFLNLPAARRHAFFQALSFTGTQMIWITLYVSMSERLALTPSQVLLTYAGGSALFLIGSPYWANKSDWWGRSFVLRIGMTALWISYTMLMALCLWTPSSPQWTFALLMAARFIYGLFASGVPAVTQAVHNDNTTQDTSSKAMISHSLSLNLGRILGLAIVVVFSGDLTRSLFLYFIVLTTIWLLSFLPAKEKQKNVQQENLKSKNGWRTEFFKVRWILALAFLFSAFAETINSSLAATLKKALSVTSAQSSDFTARLLLFACLGVAILQIFNRALLIKLKYRSPFYLGLVAIGLGIFSFCTASSLVNFWWAVALFIVGLALIPPYYMSLLRSSQNEAHYGKRAGLLGATHTLGTVLGISAAAVITSLQSTVFTASLLVSMVLLMAVFNGLQVGTLQPFALKKSAKRLS